ncbi:MAG: lipopolysaccharide assembly protein LapA domain-containing protein [Pirellulaceae bacterium]
MKKVKWILLLLVVALLLVIVFRNLETISVELLFTTVELPLAALLLATLLAGFALGFLTNTMWKVRQWRLGRSRNKSDQRTATTADEPASTNS